MDVTREVILDLLPLYLAGEASADTRALVEAYLARDPDLARVVGEQSAADSGERPASAFDAGGAAFDAGTHAPPPELELDALRRTRRTLGRLRWLFGLAVGFTALSLASEFSVEHGRPTGFHFLIRDYPVQFGAFAALAILCWLAYFALRRRLRSTAL